MGLFIVKNGHSLICSVSWQPLDGRSRLSEDFYKSSALYWFHHKLDHLYFRLIESEHLCNKCVFYPVIRLEEKTQHFGKNAAFIFRLFLVMHFNVIGRPTGGIQTPFLQFFKCSRGGLRDHPRLCRKYDPEHRKWLLWRFADSFVHRFKGGGPFTFSEIEAALLFFVFALLFQLQSSHRPVWRPVAARFISALRCVICPALHVVRVNFFCGDGVKSSSVLRRLVLLTSSFFLSHAVISHDT